jgi:hypothetical protein
MSAQILDFKKAKERRRREMIAVGATSLIWRSLILFAAAMSG